MKPGKFTLTRTGECWHDNPWRSNLEALDSHEIFVRLWLALHSQSLPEYFSGQVGQYCYLDTVLLFPQSLLLAAYLHTPLVSILQSYRKHHFFERCGVRGC